MAAYLSKILGAGGLLLAVASLTSLPVLSGYDAATGATSTTATPPPTVTTQRYIARIGRLGRFTRTVTGRKEQFTGTVRIPLSNTALGLTHADTATTADVVLVLNRQGVAYAECTLDFVSINQRSQIAKYKVDVLSRRGLVQQKAGLCQLLVAPAGPGIPQPTVRDKLELKLHGEQHLGSGVFIKRR